MSPSRWPKIRFSLSQSQPRSLRVRAVGLMGDQCLWQRGMAQGQRGTHCLVLLLIHQPADRPPCPGGRGGGKEGCWKSDNAKQSSLKYKWKRPSCTNRTGLYIIWLCFIGVCCILCGCHYAVKRNEQCKQTKQQSCIYFTGFNTSSVKGSTFQFSNLYFSSQTPEEQTCIVQ